MTAIPVTKLTRDGVADPAVTAGDTIEGHTIANGGKMWFEMENTDASAHTVNVNVPGDIDGQVPPDRSYTLAAGEKRRSGSWPVTVYGNQLDLTVDSATVEFRAFSL